MPRLLRAIAFAAGLIVWPIFASADGLCLTPQEGNLITRALDAMVRQQGLVPDSKAAVELAIKLADNVKQCELAAHDAAMKSQESIKR